MNHGLLIRMRTSGAIVLLAALLFALPGARADGVRKIVHPDGSIEFTNVAPGKKKNVIYTDGSPSSVSRIYKYKDSQGATAFSDKTPVGRKYEIIKLSCYACDPDSTIDWHHVRLNLSAYSGIINRVAREKGVEPALVRALIHAESGFNPNAVSNQGAQGLMQLMPPTARELGVRNAMDVRQNITAGITYLARLLKQFDGDIQLASAAYNAGPDAVRKYAGVPPYRETRTYVKRVGILHQRYQAALKVGG
jgi:soluble lytic murein transglycosylase-like protein